MEKFFKRIVTVAKVIGALIMIAAALYVLYICFIFLGCLWTDYGPGYAILAAIYMISFVVFINDTRKS